MHKGGSMVPNILFFGSRIFNAAIFLVDNFCNCLNSCWTPFGEKKKKRKEIGRVVFELLEMGGGGVGAEIDLPLKSHRNPNICFSRILLLSLALFWPLYFLIRPFYKARAPVRLTQERPKCALHHGKMSTNKCRARYEITHEHVSNDLKMWIKRLHTEIHNMITIYIHYKYIYFKIITCIILGLVNSNVFACKTNSAFNDFVDSCVTGKRNHTGPRAL